MQPYSNPITMLVAARRAPPTHSSSASPTLPVGLTMEPGVAKIPEPITREMMRIYALLQERFRPRAWVSGMWASSIWRLGLMFSVSPSKSQDEEDEERSGVETEASGSFVCIIVKTWSD